MADFNKSFELIKSLEFSKPENALHYNKGEDGLTFMGIYQKAHPDSKIWDIVFKVLKKYRPDLPSKDFMFLADKKSIKKASVELYNNKEAVEEVKEIYKKEFWDKFKGDEIKSQKVADEIFVFGVNAGIKRAIKLAQKLAGVTADGIVGPVTLKALNSINDKLFDIAFDLGEENYYKSLALANERYKRYLKGWENRAERV